jgi:carboxypeptidase PM20D1
MNALFIFILTLIFLLLFLILAVITILLLRAFREGRPMLEQNQKNTLPVEGLDVAAHLAEVIQCETISGETRDPRVVEAFQEMQSVLGRNFPLLHNTLHLDVVDHFSLLYTWQGEQPQLDPVLLAAHQDVVPVDSNSLSAWDYPPFSGAIADGYVWGRGTMDVKCQMITIMEAIEMLLQSGYQPQRTIYLAFGHDEETSGQGAAHILELLKLHNIKLAAVLDEGGAVTQGTLPEVDIPLALIGTVEKGSLTLELSVEDAPGHSSAPPQHTSIGILAQGLTRLEVSPMPANMRHIEPMFSAIRPYLPFYLRLSFANPWLFGGILKRRWQKNPQSNALIRTTSAITMMQAGIRINVLPPKATALVNYRLLPGDSVEEVISHTRRAIADERISIRQHSPGRPASKVSRTDSKAFHTLSDVVRGIFGDIPVAPFLVLGATDARQYTQISNNVYRFSPFRATARDMGRVHGINERISIENLELMVKFFQLLIHVWGEDTI